MAERRYVLMGTIVVKADSLDEAIKRLADHLVRPSEVKAEKGTSFVIGEERSEV